MNAKQYEDYQARVAAFIEREGLSFLSTSTADISEDSDHCEPWFSWRACQCCQSPDGGMREYLHARDRQGVLVTFTVCEDCVYFLNYGRLDDSTMLEIERSVSQ